MTPDDYKLANFAILRTPLLPFSSFSNLLLSDSKSLSEPIDIKKRRICASAELKRYVNSKAIQDALYVSSTSLHARSLAWHPRDRSKKSIKSQIALMKYFSRMAYRSTPFGLCAGISFVDLRDQTASIKNRQGAILTPFAEYRRVCRLDMGYFATAADDLAHRKNIRTRLKYFVNPSTHKRGHGWQYLESIQKDNRRQFQISFLETDADIIEAVEMLVCSNELRSYDDLCATLRKNIGSLTHSDACDLVDGLIDNGILISEFEPPLTSAEPLKTVLESIDKIRDVSELTAIRDLDQKINELNILPIGDGQELTANINAAYALNDNLQTRTSVLQTDLYKPLASASLSKELTGQLFKVLPLFFAIVRPTSSVLTDFKEEFRHRYGDRLVPFLHALDPDCGIAFGNSGIDDNPLISGLQFGSKRVLSRAAMRHSQDFERLMLRKLEHANRNRLTEISINDSDVADISRNSPDQFRPTSFFAVVSVLGSPWGDTESSKIAVSSIGGTSGMQLIGRFSHLSNEIESSVRSFLNSEQSLLADDELFVEIVHWPVNRIGNVILRPRMTDYELPIFGRSSAPPEHQIRLQDILIGLQDGDIFLYAPKINRKIRPRLTTAHNAGGANVHYYNFLAALQRQNGTFSSFSWPDSLESSQLCLPRVVYRDVIVSQRRWMIDDREDSSSKDYHWPIDWSSAQEMRQSLELPRFVELVRGDNRLPIDLDNPLSVDCLVSEARKRNRLQIAECLLDQDDSFVSGPEGAYCHEFIFPFIRQSAVAESASISSSTHTVTSDYQPIRDEYFLPGSNWLFAKFYCGSATADEFLRGSLRALVNQIIPGKVDRWFFLRYADPDFHIRLRFKGDPIYLWGKLAMHLHNMADDLRRVNVSNKLTFDTYEPETMRYGGPSSSESATKIFQIDSEFALELMSTELFSDPDFRWKIICKSVDMLWSAGGYTSAERCEIYSRKCANRFLRSDSRRSRKFELDARFRRERRDLEDLIFGNNSTFSDEFAIMDARDKLLVEEFAILSGFERDRLLCVSFNRVLDSLVHMSINRLAISAGSQQESIIYEYLYRLYRSKAARERHSNF